MPTVKQREYLLSVDDFNNPQVVEGKSAVALLLSRLIMLEPGSDPLHPEMGVGIKNYRFDANKNVIDEIRNAIQKQIEVYLPAFQSATIEISLNDDKTLNINITVGDITYVYSSNVSTSDSKLEDMKI